jgi:hypothetical protein
MTDANAIARHLVDLARYPIDDISTGTGRAFADQSRQEYLDTGLCMLPGFIRPDAMTPLAAEAEAMRNDAYFCKSSHNAYLNVADPDADDEAVNIQEQTFVGSVPYDKIERSSQLNQLYLWDPLKDFIGHVLGKQSFYRFADPFGACSINVFVDGGEHGWHFDESEYTVTLMLQKPAQGGAFEYVPRIRGLDDEKTRVASILKGERRDVVELPFTAGTLLIFGGRQTLHRVTRVSGERARLVPVLCYSEVPDVVNSESVRKLFWGRSGPQDATAASQR